MLKRARALAIQNSIYRIRCLIPLIRACRNMATLETLNFDNLALRSLPVDSNPDRRVRQSQVAGFCFSRVTPTPVENPRMVAFSPSAMKLLDLSEEEMQRPEAVEYFSGNKLFPGSEPAAHCYCGHQFGYFAGQLGDGAAMYLGEVVNKKGERWEIQLKGAGLTPYSRQADGRKVLRSSIREFLCSEAMHNLGIPTTRAGTCITSDTKVIRDMFYDGHAKEEPCTIVLRIAPTFLRFGSFEIFKTISPESGNFGPSVGRTEILSQLLEYTIKTFYPEVWQSHKEDLKKCYLEFFKEVVRRTARLVAQWQCVGWCHGVLNTDNMSILGLTIDYGPFGFMDNYDPDFICNTSDNGGRYTYQKQTEICKWNCLKLAEAIDKAIPLEETKPCLDIFDDEFNKIYRSRMLNKLGLINHETPNDSGLISQFLDTMQQTGADFTNCFRSLSYLPLPSCPDFPEALERLKDQLLTHSASLNEMQKIFQPRMEPRQFQMLLILVQTQPELVPALGRSLAGLQREVERLEKGQKLKEMTEEQKRKNDDSFWSAWLKDYVERLRKEEVGVADTVTASAKRMELMKNSNPRFILRNYIAQSAITAAEKGDYSEVTRVLKLLESPFSDEVDLGNQNQVTASPEGAATTSSCGHTPRSFAGLAYDSKPPEWATDLRVS